MTVLGDDNQPIHIGDVMVDRYGGVHEVVEVGESGVWYIRDSVSGLRSRNGGTHISKEALVSVQATH